MRARCGCGMAASITKRCSAPVSMQRWVLSVLPMIAHLGVCHVSNWCCWPMHMCYVADMRAKAAWQANAWRASNLAPSKLAQMLLHSCTMNQHHKTLCFAGCRAAQPPGNPTLGPFFRRELACSDWQVSKSLC